MNTINTRFDNDTKVATMEIPETEDKPVPKPHSLTLHDVLNEVVPDPLSYYHGQAVRCIVTAWNGKSMDRSLLVQGKLFIESVINCLDKGDKHGA